MPGRALPFTVPGMHAAPFRVAPVQYPGREERLGEDPVPDIAELAALAETEVLSKAGGRYALFGHSMGAMVAYELAHRLKGKPVPQPAALFVSGRQPPHHPSRLTAVSHLDDAALIREMASMGGTPAEVWSHPELVELLLPILRADFRACETWRPTLGSPLDIPVHVLSGLDDDHVVVDKLDDWQGLYHKHLYGQPVSGRAFLSPRREDRRDRADRRPARRRPADRESMNCGSMN